MNSRRQFLALSAWTFGAAALAVEDKPEPYGTVKGQFILDGAIPARKVLVKKGDTVRDAQCCAKVDILSEELIVDEKTKGIANIVVFLPQPTEVHPKLKELKVKDVVLGIAGCRFDPHILVARSGQTLQILNGDACAHNANVQGGPAHNVLVPSRQVKEYPLTRGTSRQLPMLQVVCNIHPWMKSYCFVLDHPYGTLTDDTGRFIIADLPAGELELRVWQEKSGWIDKALKVTVRAGKTTDLGTIKVPIAKFEEKKP